MNLDPILPWLLSVGLLTVRLTAALALSPAISAYGVPASVRVALTVALSLLICADRGAAPMAASWAADPSLMVVPVLAEMFIGAMLGLTMQVVLASFAIAGRLMDVQTGFSIGSVFNPVTGAGSNVLSSIMGLLGVTLFVLSNAHLQLAQLLAESIDRLPLGQFPPLNDPMQPLLAAGSMFAVGVAFAAPLAAALLLIDLALGVASRNMPQINVMLLAIPIKVLAAYAMLALTVRGWALLFGQEFSHMANTLSGR